MVVVDEAAVVLVDAVAVLEVVAVEASVEIADTVVGIVPALQELIRESFHQAQWQSPRRQ